CRSWIHQDRRLGIMTDQVSFNDGDPRGDNQCELPTILSLQALDGLSAPESRIQAVPETAEAGTPMNRDLRNCCDPYLNHATTCQPAANGSRSEWRRCGAASIAVGPSAILTGSQTRPSDWGWNRRFGHVEDRRNNHRLVAVSCI